MNKLHRFKLSLFVFITLMGIATFCGCVFSTEFASMFPLNATYCGYFAIIFLFITGVYAIYAFNEKSEKKHLVSE